MNEFLFKILFAKYKDTTIQNAEELRKKVFKDYKLLINNDLYIAINKYQVKRYGCALRIDSRIYDKYFHDRTKENRIRRKNSYENNYINYQFNKRNGLL